MSDPFDATKAAEVRVLSAHEGPHRLDVSVAAGTAGLTVLSARHDSPDPVIAAALAALCKLIVGRPLQEAADHGAIYLLHQLRPARGVSGILTVRSAGEPFALAERLIRAVYRASGTARKANLWNPDVDAHWASLTPTAQEARLAAIIHAFLHEQGYASDLVKLVSVSNAMTVMVEFAAAVAGPDKPRLLRVLEERLRAATSVRIELYVAEMTDENDIRRMPKRADATQEKAS